LIVRLDTIPGLSFGYVQFISAKLGKDPLSEFEKFDEKDFPQPQHITERQIIYTTIAKIGERGAKPFFFRHEGPAFALPGRVDQTLIELNPDDFGIRLYCGLLRPDLVLLLNGDIKTKQNPNECPNVGPHFRNAVKLMRVLLKAESDDFVRFTSSGIEMDEGFEIEI
jgi:hypothetical protein